MSKWRRENWYFLWLFFLGLLGVALLLRREMVGR